MNPQDAPPLTVRDAGDRLGFSSDTARRIFADEPGVLRFGHETRRNGRRYKRRYYSLRIPLSVFLRVQDRLRQK
jgi:hypothetical protein